MNPAEIEAVDLAEAVEALRDALEAVWARGSDRTVRFRPEPVELKVEVAVTRAGKTTGGLRWQILTLGGERSRQKAVTHTLTLRLAPVLTGAGADEQLIDDHDDQR